MQRPTCTGIRVRSPSDAHAIFHAVSLNMLPIVARRLDTEERRAISSGCVFVWEERGPNAESSCLGIERWTDSIRWGPSRVKDEFLYYQEKGPDSIELDSMTSDSDTAPHTPATSSRTMFRDNLIKQTYSVFVETNRGRRKWHLIAYFTQDSLNYLHTVDDVPMLANLYVPPGKYKSARSAKGRPRDTMVCDPFVMKTGFSSQQQSQPQPQFSPYPYPSNPPHKMDLCSQEFERTAKPPPTAALGSGRGKLAPLAYLQNIPPPRRHPLDEEALNALQGRLVR